MSVEPDDNRQVDLQRFRSQLSMGNKVLRTLWGLAWLLFFRPSPRIAFGWRRMILRTFGAKIGRGSRIYPSTRVFYPPNLVMEEQSILGPDVDCYCVDRIIIGKNSMVSQYSYLCSATHDYTQAELPLKTAEIRIGESCWVCADVFVGPGVTIHDGAVVGARSTVFRDVPAWKVVAGNPPVVIRDRILNTESPRQV